LGNVNPIQVRLAPLEIGRAKQTLARIVEERLQLAKVTAGFKWDVSIRTPTQHVTTTEAIKEAFEQYYTKPFLRRETNKDALQQLLDTWKPLNIEACIEC
jgi:hypothetical protein